MSDEAPRASAEPASDLPADAENQSAIDDAIQAMEDRIAAARQIAEEDRAWYQQQGARLATYADLLPQLAPAIGAGTPMGESTVELDRRTERCRERALRAIFNDITRIASMR